MIDVFAKIGWKNDRVHVGWDSPEEALNYEPPQSHSIGYVVLATPEVIVLSGTDFHLEVKKYDSIVRIPVSAITDIQILIPQPPVDLKEFLDTWKEPHTE